MALGKPGMTTKAFDQSLGKICVLGKIRIDTPTSISRPSSRRWATCPTSGEDIDHAGLSSSQHSEVARPPINSPTGLLT